MNHLPCINNFIKLIVLYSTTAFYITTSDTVQLQTSLTSPYAGQLSEYRFVVNRNVSVTGAVITPSLLSPEFIIEVFSCFISKVTFSEDYGLAQSKAFSGSFVNFTIDNANKQVQLRYTNFSSATQLNFTLSNVRNPLVTTIYKAISVKIKNYTNNIVDQSDASLIFSASTFSLIDNWNGIFQPGNVSTLSNLTFTFNPDIWKNGKMALTLGFKKYWSRSLQNTTTSTTINSQTRCQPACLIVNKAAFTQIQFPSLVLAMSLNNSLQIKILNILSPPTLQKVDIISVSTYETTYLSIIETGQFSLFSSKPNVLQSLAVQTQSKISQPITLVLILTTANTFGPNDTILIAFGQQAVSSMIEVNFSNGIISSYSYDFVSPKQLVFSGFSILSSTYSKMTFNITLENAITSTRSTRPIQNNKISIKRNGFLYNEANFSFGVQPVSYVNPVNVTVSNDNINFNSTMNLLISNLAQKIVQGDLVKITVPKEITVFSGSCLPIQCVGCLCNMIVANQSTTETLIWVSNFPLVSLNSFSLALQVRNPLVSSSIVIISHYDSQSFLIQQLKGQFPPVKQSTLSQRTVKWQSTSDYVYSAANYTITINLTQYQLSNGYMLLYFQRNMYLVNSSSVVVCYVNGEPICELKSNSTQDQIVVKVLIVKVNVKIYDVKLQNVRNPPSTQPFQFLLKIYSLTLDPLNNSFTEIMYYQTQSAFYRVSKPYKLTNVILSNALCQNSKLSTLSLTFLNDLMPLNSQSGILVDNPQPQNSSLWTKTINQQILWNSTQVNISVQNYLSLQPVRYSLLIKTLDFQYDISTFDIQVKNCLPSPLNIDSWKLTGLLGQSGQLTFIYNNLLPISYLLIELPLQYSDLTQIQSNAPSTVKVSLRTFKIILQNTQPVSVQIWNFTHPVRKSSPFKISTYKTSSADGKDYLVADNSNASQALSHHYDLSVVTSCKFPCKLCSSINNQNCLECYQKKFTQNYLLINSACQSSCPSSGYYFSLVQSTCKSCPSTCLICSSSTACRTCQRYYYLLNGTCLTDCPQKYFPITQNQTCSKCSYPCDKCVNQTTCLTCQGLLYLTNSRSCTANCLQNEVALNVFVNNSSIGICRKCELPCQRCSILTNNCTSCANGYYFNSGQCITGCPSPLVPSILSNVCTTCTSPCLTCMISPQTCTSCIIIYKLHSHKCLNQCPQGFYQSLPTQVCKPCPNQCRLCVSSMNCSSCVLGYKLYNGIQCLAICPLFYFGQVIQFNNSNNNDSSVINSTIKQICSLCTNENRCMKCHNQSYCSLCAINYFILDGVCLENCPVTMYSYITTCNNCSFSCLFCISSSICLVCSSMTYLSEQKCLSSCPSNQTIPIQISVDLSLMTNSTNSSPVQQLTKSCVSCESIYKNCLTCTNITCSKCKQGYVLDFDIQCKVKCQNGYINLNDKGICVKCQQQCQGCQRLLNNCTSCSSGYVIYVNANLNDALRQCVNECPTNMIKYQGQCSSCQSPCLSCTSTPSSCASCITSLSSQRYYLHNSECLRQCPVHYYKFQARCVQCQETCKMCQKDGCLQCAVGYFNSQPFTLANINNSNSQSNQSSNLNSTSPYYYYCYSQCPSNLQFIRENTCKKCSQNCKSCNTERCLQCENSHYIYGKYCVVECPLPLVNYSRSCVSKADIPKNPEVPRQPVIVVPQQTINVNQSYFSMPVPFTIGLSVVFILCLLSKCQNTYTHMSLSSYALGSFVCIGGMVYYLYAFLSQSNQIQLSQILLIIALILNYLQNMVFLILSKFTLFSDPHIRKAIISHRWYSPVILFFALIFTQTSYILFFSKLFNLSIFKLYVESTHHLKVINYLWSAQVLVYLLGVISGIIEVIIKDKTQFTTSQTVEHYYQCIDLIIICFALFLLAILNFKKSKHVYLRQENFLTTQSTIKVIFEQSSTHNIQNMNQCESHDEINVQGKSFKVANQDLHFDQFQFPSESGNKFSLDSHMSRDGHNYDNLFNPSISVEQNQKIDRNALTGTKDQLFFQQKRDVQISRKNQISQNFIVSNTIDLMLKQEDMMQQIQDQKTQDKNSQIQNSQIINSQPDKVTNHQNYNQEHQSLQPIFQNSQLSNSESQSYNLESQNDIQLSKVVEQHEQQQDLGQKKDKFIQKARIQFSVNQNQLNFYDVQQSQNNQKQAQQLGQAILSKKGQSIYLADTLSAQNIQTQDKKPESLGSLKQQGFQDFRQKHNQTGNIKKKRPTAETRQSLKKRYEKSPQKQILIPGYMFASKHYRQKLTQDPRISGLDSLFKSMNNSTLVDIRPQQFRQHQIQSNQKYPNSHANTLKIKESDNIQQYELIKIDEQKSQMPFMINTYQVSEGNKIKFYQQEQSIEQVQKRDPNRKSKSFSPNGFPKTFSKEKQIQRYPKGIHRKFSELNRKLVNINSARSQQRAINQNQTISKTTQTSKIAYKTLLQLDAINYSKPQGKRPARQMKKSKQQVSNLLSQIQRKQKIRFRSRLLEGIYGQKK